MTEKLLNIATFSDPMEAEIAKAKLDSLGIDCYLTNRHSKMLLTPGSMIEIELQVRASDQEAALRAIRV